MTRRLVGTLAVTSLALGCSSNSAAPQPSASAVTSAPSASTVTVASAAPTPVVVTGPVVFNHFVASTAPPPNAACVPVAKGAPGPAIAVATTLRRLSCEPALYYLPLEQLRKDLALPADQEISFNGPSSVTLRFPVLAASALAKAIGETAPMAARSKHGAWSFRHWNLVSGRGAEKLDRWGPGRIFAGIRVEDADTQVDEVPLEERSSTGEATVSMPLETLALKDDDAAATQLFAGLAQIASDKRQLNNEPDDVAKAAGLRDERFRVSRRTSSTGSVEIKGIDVWPARTRIGAAPIVEKLGLQGKIEPLRATDTDDYVLYAGKDDEHTWRGLTVTLRFRPRAKAADDGDAASYVLTGVTLMP